MGILAGRQPSFVLYRGGGRTPGGFVGWAQLYSSINPILLYFAPSPLRDDTVNTWKLDSNWFS